MRRAFTAAPPLLLALLVDTAPLRSQRAAAPPAETFSRARWIAAHANTNVFDGGALPAREQRPLVPLDTRLLVKAPAIATLAVAGDLLPAGAGSQPETQAEPHLAIHPTNDKRLLASWQESRFDDGGARGLGWAVSTNAGKTWRSGLLPNLTTTTGGPWQRASDPWVAFGPDGRAYYAALAFD